MKIFIRTTLLILTINMVHAQSKRMNTTEEIVTEFFSTFDTDKDWQSLLANKMNFTSPMDKVADKDKFVELDIQFRQLVQKASIKWIITKGEKASTLVDYDMLLPTGDKLKITFSEIIKVENQKIASIEVFFDTAKFYDFLSKMKK